MKKSAYRKDVIRTISRGKKRFCSILVIAALGVVMLTGLRAACVDLRRSADAFMDEQNLYDIMIQSTLGLTDDDVEVLSGLDGVLQAEGGYTDTVYLSGDSHARVQIKTISESGMNAPYLVEGTLPAAADEIAVTQGYLNDSGKSIGDTVTIEEIEDDDDEEEETDSTDAEDGDNGDADGTDEDGSQAADVQNADTEDADDDSVSIDVDVDTSSLEEEDSPVFPNTEFTITAVVTDPADINNPDSGTAFRISSTTDYTFFVTPEAVDSDVYTAVYLTVDGAAQLNCYSDAYSEAVSAVMDEIEEEIKGTREEARTEEVVSEAQEKIDDAKDTMNEAFDDADEQIADAESQLSDAREELDDGWESYYDGLEEVEDGLKELEEAKETLEEEEADAYAQIADAREELQEQKETLAASLAELEENEAALSESQAELDAAAEELAENQSQLTEAAEELSENQSALDTAKQELETQQSVLSEAQDELDVQQAALDAALQALLDQGASQEEAEAALEEEQAALDAAYAELTANQAQLTAAMEELDAQQAALDAAAEELAENQAALDAAAEELSANQETLDAAAEELAAARSQLEAAQTQLAEGEAQLDAQEETAKAEFAAARETIAENEQELIDAQSELADALTELEDGETEYADGVEEYADGVDTYESERADAEEKLSDARDAVDDIDDAVWYVQDRTALSGYANIDSDSGAIEAIGNVFPILFLAVAILISLTTVTRMVEEERGLIGTYKALGFSDGAILRKYLIFALAACGAGGLVGLLGGFILLPEIVFVIFKTMYTLPAFTLSFDLFYGILGPAIFLAGVGLATGLACRSALQQTPAMLMRPKAPKAGQKVFLEHIPVLWRNLSFLNKVAARNLFRYKKRLAMTVAGILGCTALLVCGFAIKDTVTELMPKQYEQVYRYDLMVVADDNDELLEVLDASDEVTSYLNLKVDSVTVSYNGSSMSVQMYVVPDEAVSQLTDYVSLTDTAGNAVLPDESGILITRNAAQILGFSAGDTVSLQDLTLAESEVTVSHIVQNYLGNSIYVTQSVYEEMFDTCEANGVLAQLDASCEDPTAFAQSLSRQDSITSATATQQLKDEFSTAFVLINMVVYIIIIMAAALAFVVLFTLSSTNISERERELATIKVLGFYNREVHLYVNKETLILTIMGILPGLPLGAALGHAMTAVLNMPSLYFAVSIYPVSYLYSGGLAIIFALLVQLITNRTLDGIDPAEALKSIE